MSTLTVALLQIAAHGNDQEANQSKGVDACRQAHSMGADIALFPEMWNIGYTPAAKLDPEVTDLYRAPERWSSPPPELPSDDEIWRGLPISTDSAFVRRFQALAVELDMAIALTYLQAWPGLPRNVMSLIDRHGEIVLTYAKVHTCAFSPNEAALTPGDGFRVCSLDTAIGPVQVGAMICYDRVFPESARALMLGGAELILMPNASDLESNRIAQIKSRADENMVSLALTNYPGAGQGHSLAFDGMVHGPDRPRDMLVIEAGEHEGIYPAHFDIAALRAHRRHETEGNAFRRPSRYGALVAPEIAPPFVRVDAQGALVPGR